VKIQGLGLLTITYNLCMPSIYRIGLVRNYIIMLSVMVDSSPTSFEDWQPPPLSFVLTDWLELP